jgi:G3E family GTPase
MTTPVHVISGFLGAGKTTLIRAQLDARPGEKTAIIVNDFGEASLDAVALESRAPFALTNIPGGCVCCTAPEGFVDALGAVLAEKPDRLWIEPTGLARPQDLLDTIRRCAHRDAVELQPVLVLVDPRQLARNAADAEFAALLREQAQAADVLVASRSDLCSEDELSAFRTFAAELWPAPLATIVSERGVLPVAALAWPEGEGARAARESVCGPEASQEGHGHSHHSTAGFHARSWRWSREVVFDRPRLVAALQQLVKDGDRLGLERFKGIFRTLEGVSRLEIAGGMLHDRLTSFRRDSRADAIVRGDATALTQIEHALHGALLSEEELRLDAEVIEVVLPDGAVHGIDRERLLNLPDGVTDISVRFPKRAGSAARVSALFENLGLAETGHAVVVAGDGFAAEPVALAVLRQGVLLHTLAGEPLPAKQGGPFRLLIPEDASSQPVSCANVKGVAKIVVREA